MVIEREIKILSHISDLEAALDRLGVASITETQTVMSIKLGKESHKLKIKRSKGGTQTEYLYSKKCSVKTTGKKVNKNFSNKLEEEISYTREEFNTVKKLFKTMYSEHEMLHYTIEKKRYAEFMGYKIDICQVLSNKGKLKCYKKPFIEVEESCTVKKKDRISLDNLIKILVPEATDVRTVSCGMRNLNKLNRRFGVIRPSHDEK